MNLKPLFEMQKLLDDRIVKEKGLEGQDLLPKKILALQVELGELAQNWRGFKFWSNDQEPRTNVYQQYGEKEYTNPLLEEYVDCLHFVLSIGLELGIKTNYDFKLNEIKLKNITSTFNLLFACFSEIRENDLAYVDSINVFLWLGQMFGFTWEQIEQAYMDKNKVNHERQNNGY